MNIISSFWTIFHQRVEGSEEWAFILLLVLTLISWTPTSFNSLIIYTWFHIYFLWISQPRQIESVQSIPMDQMELLGVIHYIYK